jgi:cell fate regulator YaaT (PSP1 superfamily)
MGCLSCATEIFSGKPKGCRSNGNCQTGSCNKLNTYDWFADMPAPFGTDDFKIHEVTFSKGIRKSFFRNDKNLPLITGDQVVVQTSTGQDLGEITLSGELVHIKMRKQNVKENDKEVGSILRLAEQKDIDLMNTYRLKEPQTLIQARAIARQMQLEMKLSHVEYQADGKKATFYYIADGRVDFRELIKVYAREFKVKVEMKQIGARQEAGLVGGIGSCGRELCCATWLTDFKSVKTDAARYQNLSINMQKLTGQCGKLKCCLNYELDTYLEAISFFPEDAATIQTKGGILKLQKTDILAGLMFYSFENKPDKLYAFTIEQVKTLLNNIQEGKLIESVYEIIQEKIDEDKLAYQDLVGQISLDALTRKSKKKKKKKNKQTAPEESNCTTPGSSADSSNEPIERKQSKTGHEKDKKK